MEFRDWLWFSGLFFIGIYYLSNETYWGLFAILITILIK